MLSLKNLSAWSVHEKTMARVRMARIPGTSFYVSKSKLRALYSTIKAIDHVAELVDSHGEGLNKILSIQWAGSLRRGELRLFAYEYADGYWRRATGGAL